MTRTTGLRMTDSRGALGSWGMIAGSESRRDRKRAPPTARLAIEMMRPVAGCTAVPRTVESTGPTMYTNSSTADSRA